MKKILYIFFCLIVYGCINKDKIQINSEEVVYIEVYKMENHKLHFIKKVSDTIVIDNIVQCIENSHKESIKFVPKFVLICHTKTEKFSVAINGKSMSYRTGIKYVLENDFEKILNDDILK